MKKKTAVMTTYDILTGVQKTIVERPAQHVLLKCSVKMKIFQS